MKTTARSSFLSMISGRSRWLPLVCLLASGWSPSAVAGPDKDTQTPCFCQSDPEAGFENGGADYCAPVSVSDGLVYLQKVRGFDNLMEATDHDGQTALIKELAAEMNTDPSTGTGPGQIMLGLASYVKKHGYSFKRLQVMTWRDVGSANKKYKVGAAPDLEWMISDANNPDVIVIFNFGWYKEKADGTYERLGGHWVNVVGAVPGGGRFKLHNPLLKPEKQATNNEVTLEPIDDDFFFTDDKGKESSLTSFYRAHGPGLPFGVSAAVLDGVIVFQLQRD